MPPETVQNFLLKHLPKESLAKILQKSKFIEHPRHTVVAERNEPMKYVYFPEEGMVSIVLVTGEGTAIEVGTIGKEGFVGIPIVLGTRISDRKMFSQVPGRGWRIETKDFEQMIERYPELRTLCQLFTLTMINQISQTAACNRLHSIDERCARWLLLAHDRDTSRTVELTQDFLSMMLGVRRSGVNIAMRTLEKAGLVEHGRGFVKILSRSGMESITCGCYREVRDYFESTMGFVLR